LRFLGLQLLFHLNYFFNYIRITQKNGLHFLQAVPETAVSHFNFYEIT